MATPFLALAKNIDDLKQYSMTSVKDSNGNSCLRVVDAAPFAYDQDLNAILTRNATIEAKLDALLESNVSETSLTLARSLANTINSVCIYPMQDLAGTTVKDYSPNGGDAISTNMILGQLGPRELVNKVMKFNGENYITVPKTLCSIKGLAAITWTGIIYVPSTTLPIAQSIYQETVEDSGTSSRFYVQLLTTKKIKVFTRTTIGSQTAITKDMSTALTTGYHMLHIAVDIVADTITMYVDGSEVVSTGTVNYGASTAFADTTPLGGIYIGAANNAGGTLAVPDNILKASHIAMYSRALTAGEVLIHAQAGGFA